MKKISGFMVVLAAIVWGTTGLFVNTLRQIGFSTMELVFLRALTAFLAIGGFALLKDRSLLKIKIKDIWIFIGTGMVSYVFFTFCYFYAMELCSLSVAAVLLYTSPVFVMILGVMFLGEKFNINKLAAIIMTVVGCALVVGIVGSSIKISAFGLLVGVGAGFWYSLYTVFGSIGLKKYNTVTVTMYTFLVGTLASALFIDVPGFFAKINTPEIFLWVILTGVITCVIPYSLYTAGLSGTQATVASVLSTIEPVSATVVGVIFYDESMDIYKACGIVLVLAAIAVINIKNDKKILTKSKK